MGVQKITVKNTINNKYINPWVVFKANVKTVADGWALTMHKLYRKIN
jgi:hypothetical protein